MGFDLTAPSAYVVENKDEFYSRSVLGANVSQTMTRINTVKSSIKLPTLDMGYDLFQDDNDCSFDDGGNDLVIAQRELVVSDIKINEKYCIKELEPFFTQKILTPGGTYENIPPELRLMDILTERVIKTVELTAVRGVLGGGFANASFNLFDGMLEIISNDIAAANIPAGQQLTGALTTSNVIASFRAMYDALPLDNKMNVKTDGDWVIYTSPTAKDTYNRDFQSANGALPYNREFDQDFLDNTSIEIIALAGMENDTTQAILTRKGNFWQGTDIATEYTDLSLEMGAGSEARDLFLTGVFKLGYQSKFPDEMVVNNIS